MRYAPHCFVFVYYIRFLWKKEVLTLSDLPVHRVAIIRVLALDAFLQGLHFFVQAVYTNLGGGKFGLSLLFQLRQNGLPFLQGGCALLAKFKIVLDLRNAHAAGTQKAHSSQSVDGFLIKQTVAVRIVAQVRHKAPVAVVAHGVDRQAQLSADMFNRVIHNKLLNLPNFSCLRVTRGVYTQDTTK